MDPLTPPRARSFRLCRALLRAAFTLMPRAERAEWQDDWEGELWHRFRRLETEGRLDVRSQLDLVGRSLGAFSHALYLAVRQWRLDLMLQDLRYALRQWARKPGFAIVAVLSLGLGIGANTLIFSLVDGLVLRPFPFPRIDRLVALGVTFPKFSTEEQFLEAFSAAESADVETATRTLEHFLVFDLGNRDLGGVEEPQRLFTAFVWGDPFRTLAMPPALGRGFTGEEITQQAPAAILSHRLWRERFDGDPSLLGKRILVDGAPRTVVGIMPPRLLLLDTDLWLPMWARREELPRSRRQFNVLARLRDGGSRREADAELEAIARRVERAYGGETPEYAGWRLSATPFMDVWAGLVGPAGVILLGAVGFVLLMACFNLANLLLAKAAVRRREMAVRTALGAGRGRLLQQLLTETTLVALVGGALGVGVAFWGIDSALALLPQQLLPGSAEIGLNARVLGYTFSVSMLCGILFGLVPALQGSNVNLQQALVTEGRTTIGPRGLRVRKILVVSQVALALVLLTGAGLLVRSFLALQRVDPGVNVENVLTMRLTLSWNRYKAPAMVSFFERLLEEVQAIPGVRSAAVATQFPPRGSLDSVFQIERQPSDALAQADFTIVSPSLFSTLGMPMRRGRGISPLDAAEAPPVVVVNEALVRRYFDGVDPMGQRLKIGRPGSKSPWATVVGVAADARNRGLAREARPEIFAPLGQTAGWNNQLFLLVRTEGEAMNSLPAVRRVIRSIDPDQPAYAIQTLEGSFAAATAQQRIGAWVLAGLAAVALALSAVGIYGVTAYTVTERAQEIGIRMALGAGRGDVLGWVARQTLALTLLGVVLGGLGSLALSRALTRLLFQVSPTDVTTLVAVSVVLSAIALVAGYLPARRASHLDPVEALRCS